jgi:hypothetical protein
MIKKHFSKLAQIEAESPQPEERGRGIAANSRIIIAPHCKNVHAPKKSNHYFYDSKKYKTVV